MKKIVRFIRRWWWAVILLAAAVGWFLWQMLGGSREPGPPPKPPKFLDLARNEVEKVHLEGEVEKAKVRTVAKVQNEQIDAIEEKGKKDPAAARKELADFLAANL